MVNNIYMMMAALTVGLTIGIFLLILFIKKVEALKKEFEEREDKIMERVSNYLQGKQD